MDDVRAVMDAAGSGRAVLLGASEGAPMSILFAATYPERTRALVLYGGYAHFHTWVMGTGAAGGFHAQRVADDDLEEVAHNMAEIKLRRLPVLNSKKRLVGIISLAGIALADGPDPAGHALCGISEPGGDHSQSADGKGAIAH
jgi:pimeloyl-ACP methyl ester carboxylesterase